MITIINIFGTITLIMGARLVLLSFPRLLLRRAVVLVFAVVPRAPFLAVLPGACFFLLSIVPGECVFLLSSPFFVAVVPRARVFFRRPWGAFFVVVARSVFSIYR